MERQLTMSISIPGQEIIDLVETMAMMHNRSRSQQVVYLIREAARKEKLLDPKKQSATAEK
jgi:hypothetical protein